MSNESTITHRAVPNEVWANGLPRPVLAAKPNRDTFIVVADISDTNDLHPFVVWRAFWRADQDGWLVESGDYCTDYAEAIAVWGDRS